MYEGDDDVETGVEERGPSDLIDLICRDCTTENVQIFCS